MELPIDKYLREHSTKQDAALAWIQKQSNLRTKYPRMISGPIQGRFLKMIVEMLKPKRIMEIGAFTGYSSVCMALGLKDINVDGHIDSLELNDELEDLIFEGYERAGVRDKITLHLGDARETLLKLRKEILNDETSQNGISADETSGDKTSAEETSGEVKEDLLYDMVFMDANKREYCQYYDLLFDLVRPGGFILADDVLWAGKVYENPMPTDKQTLGIDNFNKKIVADNRVESVILPIRDGINLIRKKLL